MGGLDQVFGVWHEAEHVLLRVQNAGNVVDRPVGVGAVGIAECHLAIAFNGSQGLAVGEIVIRRLVADARPARELQA